MNRNRWLIVIAIALVLSAGLTYLIFRIVKQRLQPPEETTKIVVAAKKLTRGMSITEEDVALADWPKSNPLVGSFQDLDSVIGRGVVITIFPNEAIIDAKLAPREKGAGLTSAIPDGMRAVAIKVNSETGVSGFVQPQDHVDLVITGTPPNKNGVSSRIFLENIEVLSAGTRLEQDAQGRPQNVPVVNVLVTPEQLQELVLAGSDRIQLALRNSLDTEEVDPEATERDALFVPEKKAKPEKTAVKKSVSPRPRRVVAPPPPPPPKPEPPVKSIEVFRGNSKEIQKFNGKTE